MQIIYAYQDDFTSMHDTSLPCFHTDRYNAGPKESLTMKIMRNMLMAVNCGTCPLKLLFLRYL